MGRLSYAPLSMSYSAATLAAMPGSVGAMRVLMWRDHVTARVGEEASAPPSAPVLPVVGGSSAMCVATMPVDERPVKHRGGVDACEGAVASREAEGRCGGALAECAMVQYPCSMAVPTQHMACVLLAGWSVRVQWCCAQCPWGGFTTIPAAVVIPRVPTPNLPTHPSPR